MNPVKRVVEHFQLRRQVQRTTQSLKNRERILRETEEIIRRTPRRLPDMTLMHPSHLTEDRHDPRLGHGSDTKPGKQNELYLVLPEDETEYVRPVRRTYLHDHCNGLTTMGVRLAKTYARDPKFYGSTYCANCLMHKPVGEFRWYGTEERVGS